VPLDAPVDSVREAQHLQQWLIIMIVKIHVKVIIDQAQQNVVQYWADLTTTHVQIGVLHHVVKTSELIGMPALIHIQLLDTKVFENECR
jgi:hypothetical protein